MSPKFVNKLLDDGYTIAGADGTIFFVKLNVWEIPGCPGHPGNFLTEDNMIDFGN